MSTACDLNNAINIKTVNFVPLSIVTTGMFPSVRLYRYTRAIEFFIRNRIAGDTFLIWMTVCSALAVIFATSGAGRVDDTAIFSTTGVLPEIACSVFIIVWIIGVKTMFQDNAQPKPANIQWIPTPLSFSRNFQEHNMYYE